MSIDLASLSLHVCFFLASNYLTHQTEIHPFIFDCMILPFSYKHAVISEHTFKTCHSHIQPHKSSKSKVTDLIEGRVT